MGADYIHAILTGYTKPDDPQWNLYYPGHKIAMPQPITDGAVDYKDGTPPTLDNYSKDVAAFLSWAAEPNLPERKRIGLPGHDLPDRVRGAALLRQEADLGIRALASQHRGRRAAWIALRPLGNSCRSRWSGVSMSKAIVGVIGGSGVYDLPGLTDLREERVATPWGDPSDSLRFGRVGETQAVFLARHGRGHRFSPSTINYRANIDALKRVGVTDIIALSACGSFHRELYPGMFVMIDQFEDRTYRRQTSFFGDGCVAHVSMAHPIAPLLRRRLVAAAEAETIACRDGGTYVCIEGPQFSSLAESLGFQARGADVIGMTGATEAKLAREAEISYATIAMVTDYDCWHEEHGAVDVAAVIKVMGDNANKASAVVARTLREFPVGARSLSNRVGPRA